MGFKDNSQQQVQVLLKEATTMVGEENKVLQC